MWRTSINEIAISHNLEAPCTHDSHIVNPTWAGRRKQVTLWQRARVRILGYLCNQKVIEMWTGFWLLALSSCDLVWIDVNRLTASPINHKLDKFVCDNSMSDEIHVSRPTLSTSLCELLDTKISTSICLDRWYIVSWFIVLLSFLVIICAHFVNDLHALP